MSKILIIVSALLLGVFARWIPHPPNFTPIIAIAIFMGMRFKSKLVVTLVPLAIMIVSDFVLGFHNLSIFTYSTLVLLALIIYWLPKSGSWKSSALKTVSYSLGGSIWFFVFSNAAVWWKSGLYSLDFSGLTQCYIAAIPFFHNTLISTLVFTAALMALDKIYIKTTTVSPIKI